MGGAERVARQKSRGKLTVRERIDGAARSRVRSASGAASPARGATTPTGRLTGFRASSCLVGRGAIDGRTVVVSADDFTIRGGSSETYHHEKNVQAELMAAEYGLPLVRLLDGTGGGGSVAEVERLGATYVPYVPGFDQVVANLGRVPVVSLGLGAVAGLGAARLVASHYSMMVRGLSQMFTAGPPVVEAAGEKVTADQLGGADLHAGTGSVDDVVDSEADAFARARRFLSYLPDRAGAPPRARRLRRSRRPRRGVARRARSRATGAGPTRSARSSRPCSIAAACSRSAAPGASRSSPRSRGSTAGRWRCSRATPGQMGGTWTAAASRKMARLVELAETFRLPVVHFVDVGGFTIGSQAEKAGTIRDGTRAIATIYQSTVPWCAVILRRAFGVAGAGMIDHTRFRYRIAWPSGDWGSLPVEGGLEAAFKAQIEAAADPDAAEARDPRAARAAALAVPLGGALLRRGDRAAVRRRGAGCANSRSSPPAAPHARRAGSITGHGPSMAARRHPPGCGTCRTC